MRDPAHERRSTGFLLIYALANAGGVIAYFPLLTLFLPIEVARIAGPDRVEILALIVVAGALAASVSNIVFGALSDRSAARGDGRRRWMAGGGIATALCYAVIAAGASPIVLVVGVILFQIAVNALLAPLFAIMADEVPDAQKGLAGGLLAMASPVAAALTAALVSIRFPSDAIRLAIVPLAMAACTIPLMLTRARPAHLAPSAVEPASPSTGRRDLVLAWLARLLVQVAGGALFVYLLYYLESVAPGMTRGAIAGRMGMVMIVAYAVPVPVAILVGQLADRTGRTRPFLFAASAVAASGLVAMAFAQSFVAGAAGFCVYSAGASVFLALHATFAMQLLPSPRHRGRDLGLLNLTNTLPSLVGPTLTWALATPTDFGPVMLVLAALTLCGGAIILATRGRR